MAEFLRVYMTRNDSKYFGGIAIASTQVLARCECSQSSVIKKVHTTGVVDEVG